jgi:S1-C subfamily serine protease
VSSLVSRQELMVACMLASLLLGGCSPGARPTTPSGPSGGGQPGLPVGGGASSCAVLTPPLGVTVTPTLTVIQVISTLPGGRAGLRPGDVLEAIDGISVTGVDDAMRALDQAAAPRAGPCNDVIATALDPRTGRVVAISTPFPTPTPGPGVAVTIRRDGAELTMRVDLRWPDPRTGESTPPARGTAYTL